MTKYDSIVVAIDKVLKDNSTDDKTKLERIEAYIEVYIENREPSESDYL